MTGAQVIAIKHRWQAASVAAIPLFICYNFPNALSIFTGRLLMVFFK